MKFKHFGIGARGATTGDRTGRSKNGERSRKEVSTVKRSTLIATAFALVAMVAACTDMNAPDASGPLFRHSGDHTVPIKGDIAYFTDFDQPPILCVGGFAAGVVLGSGEASHLGKTAFEFHTAACETDFGAATLTAVGMLTLTGANGDAISGDATVIFDVSGVLSGTSLLGALEITGSITGGTGRFEGATGSLGGTGVNDFSTGTGTFSLNGTVSSVGSLKQ